MKRFALTLPVLFAMIILAQAQVKLTIKLYPVQTIEYSHQFPDNHQVENLEIFGTTHLVINRLDRRYDLDTDIVSDQVRHNRLLNAYAPVEMEQHLADVVYSIEPL